MIKAFIIDEYQNSREITIMAVPPINSTIRINNELLVVQGVTFDIDQNIILITVR